MWLSMGIISPMDDLVLNFKAYLPNPLYPDGTRLVVEKRKLPIKIVNGNGNKSHELIPSIDFIVPFVYVSAYQLAKSAGYKGTLQDYIEVINNITAISKRAEEVLQGFDDMKKLIQQFNGTIDTLQKKLNKYPDAPSSEDSCQYALMNGGWIPIAAPGELLLVSGGITDNTVETD